MTERLRDEAHALLCQEALESELATAQAHVRQVADTRSPFAFLGSRKTKDAFATAMEEAQRGEQGVRDRLQQLQRIQVSLVEEVRTQLERYLEEASADYRAIGTLPLMTRRWRRSVDYVAEMMLAFARDTRTLLTEIPNLPAGDPAFQGLRSTLQALSHAAEDCDDLAAGYARETKARLGRELKFPAMPRVPGIDWFDGLVKQGLPKAAKELRGAEAECREFCQTGKAALLAQAPDIEADCAAAQTRYLERYWSQLREHTRRHYVTKRESDALLGELDQRVRVLRHRRQHEMITNAPFAVAT